MKSVALQVVKLGLIFCPLLVGCEGGFTSGSTSADFSKLKPACFTPSASNPVLTRDSLFSGSDWNDPTVLKVGSQYVMYASSDNNFDFNIAIYRMVSSDAVNWTLSPSTPVFEADPGGGAWDHRAVETPSVVYFNGKYHMFYTGYPTTYTDSTSYKIGHATSTDGITWVRDASYVVTPNDPTNATPNMTFDQWVAAEPAAVVFKNKIYLYFSALGANAGVGATLQVIGLTTSSDGITWSGTESVLEPDQTMFPRATWIGYSTPSAIVMNNQVHLFFDVVQDSPWKQLKLHHAKSSDGKTGWTQDTTSIFTTSDFTWASDQIRAPAALLTGTTLRFWFAGDDTSTLGIGSATCSL